MLVEDRMHKRQLATKIIFNLRLNKAIFKVPPFNFDAIDYIPS